MWLLIVAAYATPVPVPVQGSLTDIAGAPLTGSADLTFHVFRASSSAGEVTSTQTVSFAAGAFAASVPIEPSLLSHSDLMVTVTHDGVESDAVPVGWAPRAGWAAEAGHAASATSADLATDATNAATAANATNLGGVAAANFYRSPTGVPWGDVTGRPPAIVSETTLLAYIQGAAYDTLAELRAQLDSIYAVRSNPALTGDVTVASGTIQLGADSGDPCTDPAHYGRIRWNGTAFQGCTSAGWSPLGGSTSTSVVLPQSTATSCSTAGELVLNSTSNSVKVCINGTYSDVTTRTIADSGAFRSWSDGAFARHCKEYKTPIETTRLYIGATGDGYYKIDPDQGDTSNAFVAWCDMTTDGGGWTVVHSVNGADGQQPLVSDTEVFGDPVTYGQYNLSRAKKMALSALATDTLFLRNNGTWLKANRAAFDSTLNTADTHQHYAVTITANNGTTASGFMGWSNYNMGAGGDFGLTNSSNFDHHSTTYHHLNSSCTNQYLYSYSASVADSDAGYDSNIGLGSWAATNGCDSAEGGALVMRTAMR